MELRHTHPVIYCLQLPLCLLCFPFKKSLPIPDLEEKWFYLYFFDNRWHKFYVYRMPQMSEFACLPQCEALHWGYKDKNLCLLFNNTSKMLKYTKIMASPWSYTYKQILVLYWSDRTHWWHFGGKGGDFWTLYCRVRVLLLKHKIESVVLIISPKIKF